MNILEKIRDAEPGSMVTISSPCKEGGCATAESSFPVDDLRKAMNQFANDTRTKRITSAANSCEQ